MRIVATPVSASPARIAAWIGRRAAPARKQRRVDVDAARGAEARGSRPAGSGRRRRPRSPPAAPREGARRSSAFALHRLRLLRRDARATPARAATADGRGSACRPTGRSGCVTTSGTSTPASSSAWRDAAAKSGVPKNTVRGNRSAVTRRRPRIRPAASPPGSRRRSGAWPPAGAGVSAAGVGCRSLQSRRAAIAPIAPKKTRARPLMMPKTAQTRGHALAWPKRNTERNRTKAKSATTIVRRCSCSAFQGGSRNPRPFARR